MEYVYPAIFECNEDDSITITFPDLPGCITEGKSIINALKMAQKALIQWIEYLTENKEIIPEPSDTKTIETLSNQFITMIYIEIRDNYAVRRTVSIPKWMDDKAIDAGLSLSKVLQDALKEKFGD